MARFEDSHVTGRKRQRRALRRAPLAGACVAAFISVNAANAQSLPTGCHDANMVRATLQDERQFVLVTAVRPIPERPKNIFTSNGKFGYNIEQGTGDVTGKLCVAVRFGEAEVNDNIPGPTPSWARIGQDTEHNKWIEGQRARKDDRIVFGARVLRSENGNDVRGGFMMVTRGKNVTDNPDITSTGAITVSFDNGEIRPTVLLSNVEIVDQNYNAFIKTRMQLANPTAKPK